MPRRAGLALVLVSGTLGLLALLGTAFAALASLERGAAALRADRLRAVLLARSGLEDAWARIGSGQRFQDPGLAYRGEEWDGIPGAGPEERAEEVFRPGAEDLDGCPLRHALTPSFAVREPGGRPRLVRTGARLRGISGRLAADGSPYSLQVSEEAGIFVNGGDLSGPGEHPGTYDVALRRILGNLAEEAGGAVSRPDGEALVLRRPAGGWTSFEQVRALALGGSPDKLAALRPYLALEAWVDLKVVRGNLRTDAAGVPLLKDRGFYAWADAAVGNSIEMVRDASTGWIPTARERTGGRLPHPGGGWAPDFERDLSGRVVGRAPVNLNWAIPRTAVLRALLRGLKGLCFDPSGEGYEFAFHTLETGPGHWREAALSGADVDAVVAALQSHAGFDRAADAFPHWDGTARFDGWDEFDRFVDARLGTLPRAKRDLIKVHFNPNTRIQKFNDNASFRRLLDKGDILTGSTEFCFDSPRVRVSSLGRVLGPGGRVRAEAGLEAEACWNVLRLTAQSEFAAGDGGLGRPDLAGDEPTALARRPGAPGFLSESAGPPGETTFGSRRSGNHGWALQSYPEPQWGGGGPCPPPAGYDGSLQLATRETPVPLPAGQRLLLSFTGSLDADAGAVPAHLPDPELRLTDGRPVPVTGREGSPSEPLLAPATARTNPLRPDGCYAERGRTPGYRVQGNFDGTRSLLSMWVKPSFDFDPLTSRRGHMLAEMNGGVPGDPAQTQFLGLACPLATIIQGGWGSFLEPDRGNLPGMGVEYELGSHWTARAQLPRAGRWSLVTLGWDVRPGIPRAQSERLLVDDAPGTGTYTYAPQNNTSAVHSFSAEASTVLWLGRSFQAEGLDQAAVSENGNPIWADTLRPHAAADATLDEVLVADPGAGLDRVGRYRDGRYHKEDAGADFSVPEWTSAALTLGRGARVARAFWTLLLPRYDPADSADPNRTLFGTGADPLRGQGADGLLHLIDPASGASETRAPGEGGPSRSLAGEILRVGVTIRPRLGDNDPAGVRDWTRWGTPLLESPVLDDLTLFWQPAGGLRLVRYGPPAV